MGDRGNGSSNEKFQNLAHLSVHIADYSRNLVPLPTRMFLGTDERNPEPKL